MRTNSIKISYLDQIFDLHEPDVTTYVLLTYNDNNGWANNVKMSTDDFLDKYISEIPKASNDSYGVVKTYDGILNNDGVISIDMTYVLSNTKNNSYIFGSIDEHGILRVDTSNGLVVENGIININKASTSYYGSLKIDNSYGSPLVVNDGVLKIDTSYLINDMLENSPLATKDTPGMVVIGENITLSDNGVISLPVASTSHFGVVKIDSLSSLYIDNDNKLGVNIATSNRLGVVKASGKGINIENGGNLSIDLPYISAALTGASSSYASETNVGMLRVDTSNGLTINDGLLGVSLASYNSYGTIKPHEEDFYTDKNSYLRIIDKSSEIISRMDSTINDINDKIDNIDNKVDSLENNIMTKTTSISVSPQTIERNVKTNITITTSGGKKYAWSSSLSSPYILDNASLNNESIELSNNKYSFDLLLDDTTSIITYTIIGEMHDSSNTDTLDYNKSVTISSIYPLYIGASDKDTLESISDVKSLQKNLTNSNVSGYTVKNAIGKYLWICVPNTKQIDKDKVESGGFGIDMNDYIEVDNYRCYKSTYLTKETSDGINLVINIYFK